LIALIPIDFLFRRDLAIDAVRFFCYATFELTSLSLLKHWTWPMVMVDVSWSTLVTAVSSTIG
jgi:uncharacterized membrane protein